MDNVKTPVDLAAEGITKEISEEIAELQDKKDRVEHDLEDLEVKRITGMYQGRQSIGKAGGFILKHPVVAFVLSFILFLSLLTLSPYLLGFIMLFGGSMCLAYVLMKLK